jgi:hypothetical protein
MKGIKLLALVAASFVINACPLDILSFPGDDDDDLGTSSVWLRVENKTDIPFYLNAISEGISGRVYEKQECLLFKYREGPIDATFSGYIDFYYIIDDGKPDTSEDKLIKYISAASAVMLIEDSRNRNDVGKVVFKIIVTNEMLGITANTGSVQVEYKDNAGGEDDEETPEGGAENGGGA